METLVRRHDEIMSKYDPNKRIALVVDEWGAWHQVEKDTNPGFLYQQNTVRDALVAGITLNVFNNHSDRVRVANIAQAVNVLQSPVLTEGKKLVKTPTWYVFHMYKAHMDATLLKSTVATGTVGIEDDAKLDAITASASRKDETYTITLTNADFNKDRTVKISLEDFEGTVKSAEALVVTGTEPNSMNTFDNPDQVIEKPLAVKFEGNELCLELPAHSVTTIYAK